MDRKTLIKSFIEYYKSKGHKEIPNSSLIPENDPTTLFISAGMHPLVPYLLGAAHPLGKRLGDSTAALPLFPMVDKRFIFFVLDRRSYLGFYWLDL